MSKQVKSPKKKAVNKKVLNKKAPAKKTEINTIKKKINSHQAHVKKAMKLMNANFLYNRLMEHTSLLSVDPIEPFEFIITIVLNPRISIKYIIIQGKWAKKEDIVINEETIVATIKAIITSSTYSLTIKAEGDSYDETTFNMTCDAKKVFIKDQKLIIDKGREGVYINTKIKV